MKKYLLICAVILLASCAANNPPQYSSAEIYDMIKNAQDSTSGEASN